MIAVITITHGLFGQELLRTAQDIAGRQEAVASISVSSNMGPQDLSRSLDETLKALYTPDGVLIFVDMLGGTPCNTALLRTKDMAVEVLTGVNLYMLLSSFNHRQKMDLKTLSAKVADDGRRAVLSAKELLMKRLSA